MPTNQALHLAEQYVKYTNKYVFLTGKAGTGKTTFLKNLRYQTAKRMVIVAPTGVAAINAGGVTIHSLFQINFGPFIPNSNPQGERRYTKEKINAIRGIDLLVIDEISMVRADLLDAVDAVLRKFRNRFLPFGGVQLLMIGDLNQLSPVKKEDEWELLRPYYNSEYFFDSFALRQSSYITIELTHIYRQQDEVFIALLNRVRDNNLDANTLDQLNTRYIPGFKAPEGQDYITLTTHNNTANQLNQHKMEALQAKSHFFTADIIKDFPENMYPADVELQLKEGAQVMFIKNDSSTDKRYYNGKIGYVSALENNLIKVKCKGDTDEITVNKETWQNIKYELNEAKQLEENIIGEFRQYPLKAAWAITIHKSQGLTFEHAIIDAADSFAHGQVYVALSRCKTFEGMVLLTPIRLQAVKSDTTIKQFNNNMAHEDLSDTALHQAKHHTQSELLIDLFDFGRTAKSLNYFVNTLATDQKHIPKGSLEQCRIIAEAFDQEILQVTNKFLLQLKNILIDHSLPEQNETLQKRLKGGSSFLTEKINELVYIPLKSIDLESDNKEIKKNIENSRSIVLKNFFEKLALLQSIAQGFETTAFLKARADMVIDFDNLSKSKASDKASEKLKITGNMSQDLFNILKQWRNAKASELDTEAYMIITQKSLTELSEILPGDKATLAQIHGIGKQKLDMFGEEILQIIAQYAQSQGKENQLQFKTGIERKPKVAGETFQESLALYQSGKSIDEIATIRGLSKSTIEGHLSKFVENGTLDITELIEKQTLAQILETIKNLPDATLTQLRESLGEEISFGQIRLALGYSKNLERE